MFDRVMRTVSTDAKKNLVTELLHDNRFSSKFTSHGIEYEECMNVTVTNCGIVVCMDYPHLAATPDGLVSEDIVLEIKCPYNSRNNLITPETVPYLAVENDTLCLLKSHDYYAQVLHDMNIIY